MFFALYLVATIIAFVTAFYTFRAFFLTFYGDERVPHEAAGHAHESPPVMTVPLAILAVCSLVVGAYFTWTGGFTGFLKETPVLAYSLIASAHDEHAGSSHALISVIGTVVAVGGIGLAAFFYLGDDALVLGLKRLLKPLYVLSYGKLFFDQIYFALIVWPLEMLAGLSDWVDGHVIDGLVNFVGRIPPAVGRRLRPLGSGLLQFYALAMVWGVVVLVVTLLIWPVLASAIR